MNKTELITDAASLAVKSCIDHYLTLPGKAAELLLWFEEYKEEKKESYRLYDHQTYRSFLVWMPEGIEVNITDIYFDKDDELTIHGYFLFEIYYGGPIFDFRHAGKKMKTKLNVFVDEHGYPHDIIKLRSDCVHKVLSCIKSSYAHLGLDQD